ncbi:MAG: hypothetical protein GC131_02290 [Alphaproteobacteria bacterium]|nr:hypothetical protein [Alphaproteobacteria bacterium]
MTGRTYINLDGSPYGSRGVVRLLTTPLARTGMLIALFVSAALALPVEDGQAAFLGILLFNVPVLCLVLALDKMFARLLLGAGKGTVIDKSGYMAGSSGNPATSMKMMTGFFFAALAYGVSGAISFDPYFSFSYYCMANSGWYFYALYKLLRGKWAICSNPPAPDLRKGASWMPAWLARPQAQQVKI